MHAHLKGQIKHLMVQSAAHGFMLWTVGMV